MHGGCSLSEHYQSKNSIIAQRGMSCAGESPQGPFAPTAHTQKHTHFQYALTHMMTERALKSQTKGRACARSQPGCEAFPWRPTRQAPHESEATSLEIQSLFSTSLLVVCSSRLLVAGFLPLKRVKHKLSLKNLGNKRPHTNPPVTAPQEDGR